MIEEEDSEVEEEKEEEEILENLIKMIEVLDKDHLVHDIKDKEIH